MTFEELVADADERRLLRRKGERKRADEFARRLAQPPPPHDSRPEPIERAIRTVAEPALQRALLFSGTNEGPHGERIEWKDMEIPVGFSAGQSRRPCVDLVGKRSDGQWLIVELKFRSSTGSGNDSPAIALLEAIHYERLIKENWEDLRQKKIWRETPLEWEEIANNASVVVAANQSYWQAWASDPNPPDYLAQLWALADRIGEPLEFWSCSDVDFAAMREQTAGQDGKYEPELPDNFSWSDARAVYCEPVG